MERVVQPCDWYEHDTNNAYVVDVFGRTDQGKVACVRITGFKPYFYVRGRERPEHATQVRKYDVMAGFNSLTPIDVWRVECPSKAKFSEAIKKAKGILYESNLPPFLRMFHERHLGPASPIRFRATKEPIPQTKSYDEEGDDIYVPIYQVDEFYQVDVKHVHPEPTASIPLKVACYDLEMYSQSGLFPRAAAGDPIVQMGISYRWSNDMLTPIRRVVFVVGTVDASDDGAEFVSCRDETDMLYRFNDEIDMQNPDILCGYNTFGFDDAYIEDRCRELGILDQIELARYTSKFKDERSGTWKIKFSETKKFELASGKYDLRYLCLRGRLGLDLLLNMRREHSLDSFKLDNVASVFLRDKVLGYENSTVSTKSTRGLRVGNYIRFDIVGNTTDPYREGDKFVVTSVSSKSYTIRAPSDLFGDLSEKERKSLEWTFAKDDVEPHELFELHANGGPAGRARIAKYCIQDCDLVLTLMAKLDTIVNARGMADVCKVPMEYVLRRGQGIKIFSAVVYYASQRDQIIQTQAALDDDTGYEGAIVISPKIGMYLDQPISVLDFNSLYPTNMIAYNISPDTLVSVRVFDQEGNRIDRLCEGFKKEEFYKFEEQGYVLDDVEYDNKDDKGNVLGKTICTYIQADPNNPMTVGVLPKTLDILLKKRKEFKEKMEDTNYDEAQRSVFNGLQLAYKVVANSVYGQTGSRTSPIRRLCVAACTTAAGRKALGLAKHIVETEFGADVIYGDTDSIFIKFPTTDLAESIRLGIAAGRRITEQCRRPYKIAYEKTFYPFILFCRKRYVGMMYEEDATAKPKRKSMGIVLKRRDNAPIVKDVFGGALDVLLQEKDVRRAQSFVNEMLLRVLRNEVPLEKFIVSKSLRDDYITAIPSSYVVALENKIEDLKNKVRVLETKLKTETGDRRKNILDDMTSKRKQISVYSEYISNGKATYNVLKEWSREFQLPIAPSSIAHRTLADRMESRDPGTAPKVGDRIQYIYAAENKSASKQGDRIEEVGYVRKNRLTPDTEFYITNQIKNPVAQLFALCIEEMNGFIPPRHPTYQEMYEQILEKLGDEEEATLALLAKKEKQLEGIMFLSAEHMLRARGIPIQKKISSYFTKQLK